ncbi:uncharacterized protein LAESUDRAFT_383922 [Laetiporus sulphureus 93-53]|uniref:Uncharacterized protein n=1 Tax=Laetiporus sulphureus 93-53 TaxID=1314785 RepID=A0A165CMF9_9APHY|nr:uncharacterized protein LAESUDRAFT_383922 [Laetiporus sulphureus 93-53]KZT03075.1 hypothetical protein LAESUDRAFT_383922 [Laetiporus sulphureus 93-53]
MLRICSTCILPWTRAWGLRGIATVLVLICIVFVVGARLRSYRFYLFIQRILVNDFTWACRAFGTLIADATDILDASH